MFQQKIEAIFKEPPNVFGIVGDILIVCYDADGRDHNKTLRCVMQICYKENLWQTKTMSFQIHEGTIFDEILFRARV